MQHPLKPLATALAATLQIAATAAVPLAWDARPGAPAPASFDRYHGETLEFRCTFRGFGELPFSLGADVRLWYQTNGMGAAWWSAPATIRSNVLSAVWSPELDPGADRVSLYFGAPSNAYASAVLRLRHSPGFAPGAMPDPIAFHESDPVFAEWLATNVPNISIDLTPATNYTDALETNLALGNKSVMSATYAYSAYDSRFLYDEAGILPYSATDLIRGATNAAEAVVAPIRTESSLVYRLYSGSNVVAEVTNYNSQVHAPSLRLMQLNESNEYVTVWTETNGLARTLASAKEYADAAITNAAPRAWSRTTSGLGAEAPANTTWISTPTTVIAGGFEYAKFVDTYGEVWVLTSNGMAAEFNPDTNAYFRITADDGTPVFSIEKSDAQLVGANASGITVGESSITIPVPVVSSAAPTMYWRYALDSGDWADESSPASNMDVMWEGSAGTWQCNVTFNGTRPPSMFFKFNFLQEGGVVIRNNATTDLSSGIYINGIKYVPVANGSTLTWQAQ